MLQQLKDQRHLATTLFLISLGALFALQLGRGPRAAEAAPPTLLATLPRPPDPSRVWRQELDWSRVREDADGFVQVLRDGGRVELTLDPRLQHAAERAISEFPTPYATAVMLSVEDGRVLAMAGRSSAEPERTAADLALRAWAPAASVFKLVTAAALVDAGVGTDSEVCYHAGIHSVERSNLVSHPRLDTACRTLSFAVAKSQNAIIARLAHDRLAPSALDETARALGFGRAVPFELPVEPSVADVPRDDDLAFARVAAGFWSTTLSPLHGAYLAATLARGGVTPPLRLVDRVVDRRGHAQRPEAPVARRALGEKAARAVARMMVGTTEFGTARSAFHDRRSGRPLLPGIAVAGKTGSLSRQDPFVSYSWFVGFAPAEKPEVAFAVLLGNGAVWHKKAHQVAREILSSYFHGAPSDRSRVAAR